MFAGGRVTTHTGLRLGEFFAAHIAGPLGADFHIGTGAEHFFTKQLDAVEETVRNWAEELLEKK